MDSMKERNFFRGEVKCVAFEGEENRGPGPQNSFMVKKQVKYAAQLLLILQ